MTRLPQRPCLTRARRHSLGRDIPDGALRDLTAPAVLKQAGSAIALMELKLLAKEFIKRGMKGKRGDRLMID